MNAAAHSTGGVMAAADTFSRLMARLRSGEDAAARQVFERLEGLREPD
jgi:hypothetical protein